MKFYQPDRSRVIDIVDRIKDRRKRLIRDEEEAARLRALEKNKSE